LVFWLQDILESMFFLLLFLLKKNPPLSNPFLTKVGFPANLRSHGLYGATFVAKNLELILISNKLFLRLHFHLIILLRMKHPTFAERSDRLTNQK
jgi:hypothetical protein